MSLFTETMRRFWIPGIQNVEADLGLSFGSWLGSTNYYIHDLASPTEFSLQFSSLDDVLPLFSVTSNRTFSACFESIASIAEVTRSPRSVAWLLVKMYYAAFFAAHGHMRACGVSCANVDALDAVRIYETAKLNGVNGNVQKLNSGQYVLILNTQDLTLSFKAVSTNGSHEALWQSYKMFLDRMLSSLPDLIPIEQQRNQVADHLNHIRLVLCMKGMNGGNWLSRFRNSVQYRHSYGAWYPYSLKKSVPKKLVSKVSSGFRADPGDTTFATNSGSPEEEVETFYHCTMFLSALARATAIDLAVRSKNPKSVAKRGAVTFLRLSKFA